MLLRKRPKFGGIEMQLLYSTQVVTVSKLVVEWADTTLVFCSFVKENRWW